MTASNSKVMVTRKKRTLCPLGAGGHSQGRGKVRLARPTGTDEQHVLAAVQGLTLQELQHLGLVDTRPRCEVELVQELVCREAGSLEPALGRLAFPLDQLQLAELQQEGQVIGVVLGSAGGDRRAFRDPVPALLAAYKLVEASPAPEPVWPPA
jgi:hypothetical protein